MRTSTDYNVRGASGPRPEVRGQGSGARSQGPESGSRNVRRHPLPTTHYPPPVCHWLSQCPPSPRGFTLVEMLVVVSIMMLLVTVAATAFRPADDSRRIREAARSINVYLSSARNRAIETGRPCGVTLRQFDANIPCAMTLDQCKVPPNYCGDIEGSYAAVEYDGAAIITATLCVDDAPVNLLGDDDLIQFNYQGPWFEITNIASGANWVLTCNSGGLMVPWNTLAQNVPYRIMRSPIKAGASPLQLPAATVVDLQFSGYNTGQQFNAGTDVTVLFAPNGSVQAVYYGGASYPITEQIFLLVGKRERTSTSGVLPTYDASNPDTFANWNDLNNLWVVINSQTGLVTTGQIKATSVTTNDSFDTISRDLARDAQGMGGK